MKNKKGFANLVLIGVLVILIGLSSYFAWKRSNVTTIPKITEPIINISSESSVCEKIKNHVPVIISLSTYSASIGEKIKIKGCNLGALEGDKKIWIENLDKGVKGFLEQYDPINDPENMEVILPPKICEIYITDVTCKEWSTLSPGVYKIYGTEYQDHTGTRSNIVNLTIK